MSEILIARRYLDSTCRRNDSDENRRTDIKLQQIPPQYIISWANKQAILFAFTIANNAIQSLKMKSFVAHVDVVCSEVDSSGFTLVVVTRPLESSVMTAVVEFICT